jgi:NAD(P)H-nitrite reductase large subunit
VEVLTKLETEQREFQAQMFQLDRQIDAIARNDRLIDVMQEREETIEEHSRFEAASLDQFQSKMADIRAGQEAQLERLASAEERTSYEEMAKQQLDARGSKDFAPRFKEIEIQPQVLPAYFDADAAAIIAHTFMNAGVDVRVDTRVSSVAPQAGGFTLQLAGGESLPGDLLVVGTGVTPVMDYLEGTPVATDRGILVDDTMRTNVNDVWAAGDVAQARGFYTSTPVLNGILPYAVEQGRIAGMAMADDPALETYRGGVPLNTYSFWGRHAMAVGTNAAPAGAEVVKRLDEEHERYLKIVLAGNRLHGIFGVNEMFDAGVMWELILRRVDLGPVRERFLTHPNEAARAVMSRTWR